MRGWGELQALKHAVLSLVLTQDLAQILVPVAKAWQLPVGMKIGCLRNMNPDLSPCGGGDGVVVADLAPLRRLVSQVRHLPCLLSIFETTNRCVAWHVVSSNYYEQQYFLSHVSASLCAQYVPQSFVHVYHIMAEFSRLWDAWEMSIYVVRET
jgi:hypothetical protein